MGFNFVYTNHAKKRLKERKIDFPNGRTLKVARKKLRVEIEKKCKRSGYKDDLIYLTAYENNPCKSIYVCKQLEINELLVITAFKINHMKDLEQIKNNLRINLSELKNEYYKLSSEERKSDIGINLRELIKDATIHLKDLKG